MSNNSETNRIQNGTKNYSSFSKLFEGATATPVTKENYGLPITSVEHDKIVKAAGYEKTNDNAKKQTLNKTHSPSPKQNKK